MPDLPTIVYRCPGPFQGSLGTTFNSVGVDNADELAARLADGWHCTMPEAIDAYLNPQPVVTITPTPEPEPEPEPAPIPDDDAPPTREEMVAKAALLGLRVDRRWSDETLLARIAVAMAQAPAPVPAPAAPAPASAPADPNEDPI